MELKEVSEIDLGRGALAMEELAARLAGQKAAFLHGHAFGREKLSALAGTARGQGCLLALEADAASLTGEDWQTLAGAGLGLITWRNAAEVEAKPLAALFRAAGKAGIWNRVILPSRESNQAPGELEGFVAANPNLAHSWAREPEAGPEPSVYRRVPPMPGRPRWRALPGVAGILAELDSTPPKTLARQRVREDGTIYELGKGLDFRFDAPGDLPGDFMDLTCLLVEEGGAVAPDLVRKHLHGAFVIAHCHEEGALIGVSCLKRPRPEYLEHVAKMTGYVLSGAVERGYTSVRPEYRGLGVGTRLLEGETALARQKGVPVYSILGVDNIGAQAMAKRNGSRLVCEYHSEKAGKDLGLWLPDWVDGLVKIPQKEKAGE